MNFPFLVKTSHTVRDLFSGIRMTFPVITLLSIVFASRYRVRKYIGVFLAKAPAAVLLRRCSPGADRDTLVAFRLSVLRTLCVSGAL